MTKITLLITFFSGLLSIELLEMSLNAVTLSLKIHLHLADS